MKQNEGNNPHDICAFRDVASCAGCELENGLKCRFNLRDLLHFIGLFASFALPSIIGVIQSGYGRYLWGWLAFCLFFFEVWEIRILCSHCPYYAEKGGMLHCIANYSSLKLWKYHPEPISVFEKVQFLVGFVILGGFPFPFLLAGRQYTWAATAFWSLVMCFWTLRKYICSTCVNFSCVLNTVPKELVDAYLERNLTMRKAWEESGYRLGGAQ